MPEDSVLKSIAILPNGKRSHIHSGVFKHVDLQKDTLLVGLQAGLNYSLFQAEFSSAKDVSQAKPIKQAVVQTIEIPDTLSNHEFFGLSYSGFISTTHISPIISYDERGISLPTRCFKIKRRFPTIFFFLPSFSTI